MIRGITFSLLDESTLHKKTSAYDKRLLSQKHITHLGNIAVLPYDCYPNIKRPDGEYKDNLHRLYSQLYNSLHKEHDDTQLRQNTEAIIEEIKNRWKSGKMGRWRQDLCGKRCNFTARSVLTPNPHLSLVQVGIPSIWKKTLTLQETWSPDMRVVAQSLIKIIENLIQDIGNQVKDVLCYVNSKKENLFSLIDSQHFVCLILLPWKYYGRKEKPFK